MRNKIKTNQMWLLLFWFFQLKMKIFEAVDKLRFRIMPTPYQQQKKVIATVGNNIILLGRKIN